MHESIADKSYCGARAFVQREKAPAHIRVYTYVNAKACCEKTKQKQRTVKNAH